MSLSAFSFLYKENKFYNIAESTFIGVSAGYAFVLAWSNISGKGFQQLGQGNFLAIIPLFLGFCLLSRLVKPLEWLGSYPVAMLMGIGSGIVVSSVIESELIGQIAASCLPLNGIDNFIISTGTIAAVSYFLFTIKSPNPVVATGQKILAQYGKYVMMVAFGAGYANATMQRCAQLIDRLKHLFQDWILLIR